MSKLSEIRPLSPLATFFVYGCVGWCMEVLFTSIFDVVTGVGDVRLKGYSYIWMHPIWAAGISVCVFLSRWLRSRKVPWGMRALIYALVCYLIEYTSGALIRAIVGRAPWDYSQNPGSIDGLICIEYAWGWATCGLLAEALGDVIGRLRYDHAA